MRDPSGVGIEGELDYELINMEFPPGHYPVSGLKSAEHGSHLYRRRRHTDRIVRYLSVPSRQVRPTPLGIGVNEPGFGEYLNWLYRSDAR